ILQRALDRVHRERQEQLSGVLDDVAVHLDLPGAKLRRPRQQPSRAYESQFQSLDSVDAMGGGIDRLRQPGYPERARPLIGIDPHRGSNAQNKRPARSDRRLPEVFPTSDAGPEWNRPMRGAGAYHSPLASHQLNLAHERTWLTPGALH